MAVAVNVFGIFKLVLNRVCMGLEDIEWVRSKDGSKVPNLTRRLVAG